VVNCCLIVNQLLVLVFFVQNFPQKYQVAVLAPGLVLPQKNNNNNNNLKNKNLKSSDSKTSSKIRLVLVQFLLTGIDIKTRTHPTLVYTKDNRTQPIKAKNWILCTSPSYQGPKPTAKVIKTRCKNPFTEHNRLN
jgi:hypothetical protein